MTIVYRVQDSDGRGPWKPGVSKYWIDDSAHVGRLTETLMDLCGGVEAIRKLPSGWHYGCACESLEGIAAWFTPNERIILDTMGYHPVSIKADKIMFRSEWQVLIARKRPLRVGYVMVPWDKLT